MRPDLEASRERSPSRPPSGRRLARLAFVLSLAPGLVILMVIAPALQSPGLLAAGLGLVAVGLLARRRLAAWILARVGALDPHDAPPSQFQPPENL